MPRRHFVSLDARLDVFVTNPVASDSVASGVASKFSLIILCI